MIELPNRVKEHAETNPTSLVIYGLPKAGKTTALSMLKNCLIIDMERGSNFIEGCYVMQVPENLGPVSKYKWLDEVAESIRKAGKPYDYVAIDTLSQLDELSDGQGTWNYMNSSQGKKFNRDDEGNMLKPNDPSYESVLSLGQGYGYRWTREAMLKKFESLKDLGAKCTIFVCHVSDKMISKTGGEEVVTKDLALTGKLRDIIPRNVDGIANIYNEDGEIMISFAGNEERVGGVRAKHLRGFKGKLDWNQIFIKEKEDENTQHENSKEG